jgi:hypothetical protein
LPKYENKHPGIQAVINRLQNTDLSDCVKYPKSFMEEIFTGLDSLPKDPNFVYGDTTGRLAYKDVTVNAGLNDATEGVGSVHTLIKRSLQENMALKTRQYSMQKFLERNPEEPKRSSRKIMQFGRKQS